MHTHGSLVIRTGILKQSLWQQQADIVMQYLMVALYMHLLGLMMQGAVVLIPQMMNQQDIFIKHRVQHNGL